MDLLQCTFLTFYRIIVPRECSDPLIKNCFKRRNITLSDMEEDHSLLQLHFCGMPYTIILGTVDRSLAILKSKLKTFLFRHVF